MVDNHALASELRHLTAIGLRAQDRLMRAKGVSLAQSRLLEVIQHTPRARWSDIATALGYSPRTITEALDTLERDGLITRRPDPADRRAKLLALTKKGTRDLLAAQAVRDQVREVIFGVLSHGEKEKLFKMLQRMRSSVQTLDAEEPMLLPG